MNGHSPATADNTSAKGPERVAIAVIGMAARYAGADDTRTYWENLAAGVDSIQEIPPSRWDVSAYYDPEPRTPGKIYCKWMGRLDDIECFDPLFFDIAPAEAELIDPQQRLLLEQGYKAFEDAGYGPQRLNGTRCGVYLGIKGSEYGALLQQGGIRNADLPGNGTAMAAARIASFLNLKGPALAIDTGCSSSLVAAHLACQALRSREIDTALVGGVSLYLTPEAYLGMCGAGMLSPEGRCKALDHGADGFVPGEGAGALVLRRLQDAQADGDRIYGVIIGSGVNQDGKTNGLAARSASSQIELVREIYERCEIHPETIGYVEMHATGEKLSDSIELTALESVFKEKTETRNYCALGSVKSNIGHTAAAAGVAAIQKVLLALNHRELAPTLHFNDPNPDFDLQNSPFFVSTKRQPWHSSSGKPRRAAVSSFGYSGANAHLVVEEYCPEQGASVSPSVSAADPVLIVLSAKAQEQLEAYAENVKELVEREVDIDIRALAYTLQVGRAVLDHRLAFVAESREQLLETLAMFICNDKSARVFTGQENKSRETAALFEGDEEFGALLASWIAKKKLWKLAELWVKGLNIDWMSLQSDPRPRVISAPGHPFARQRCWPERLETSRGMNVRERAEVGHSASTTSETVLAHEPAQETALVSVLADSSDVSERITVADAWLPYAGARLTRYSALPPQFETRSSEEEPPIDRLHSLLARVLFAQLQSIGLFVEPVQSLSAWQERAKSLPLYRRWLAESAIILEAQGYLTIDGDVCTAKTPAMIDPQALWSEWDRNKGPWLANPGLGAYVRLIEATLRALPDILLGKKSAQSILFPDSSMALLENLYKRNPIADYFNVALADTVADFLQAQIKHDPRTRVRILEVGAGTGGTAEPVLRRLEPYREHLVEYCYTDLSNAFLLHAKEQYVPRYPFVTTAILDAEKPVYRQSIASGAYDVVIAANVLHATRNIRRTLQNIKAALKGNGLLVLNEVTEKNLLAHLTFGLLEGWWKYEDETLRIPGSPALYSRTWQRVLQEAGFKAVCVPTSAAVGLGQHVFAALSDGVIRAQRTEARLAFPAPADVAPAAPLRRATAGTPKHNEVAQSPRTLAASFIKRTLSQVLKIPEQRIDSQQLLAEYGIDSILVVRLTNALREAFPNINSNVFFQHQTVAAMADHLVSSDEEASRRLATLAGVIHRDTKPARTITHRRVPSVLRMGGTYLITGGLGGLGQVFARHLAERYGAKLILLGRSVLDESKRQVLQELEALGAGSVRYVRADVCDAEQILTGLGETVTELHGVIHTAGVEGSGSVLDEGLERYRKVLGPKVHGTLALEQALSGQELDFICYCSSTAALLGDFGSCDYAIGNRFELAYARRCKQSGVGVRRLTIAWPLWQTGGMGFKNSQSTRLYLRSTGQWALQAEQGVELFERLLAQENGSCVVFVGDAARVRRFVGLNQPEQPSQTSAADACGNGAQSSRTLAANFIKRTLSQVLKIPEQRIDSQQLLAEYGIDSILVVRLTNALREAFPNINSNVFFQHQTVDAMADYLVSSDEEASIRLAALAG